jgi:hypothetical protein
MEICLKSKLSTLFLRFVAANFLGELLSLVAALRYYLKIVR